MPEFSLKDHLFNREKVRYLAGLFHAADSDFDHRRFVRNVMKRLPELELKQRIVLIAETLEKHLNADFREAAGQITAALPPKLDPTKTDNDFGDYIIAPLGEFVVRNGLTKKHLSLSLRTLKAITQRFSMEDAIRAFIRAFPEATMVQLQKWAHDKNYHVRRLVSEGTRPSLPWSGRVHLPLEATLPLLDALHGDPTRYVTRSVANHLNDISKTDPKLVIQSLSRWRKLASQQPEELNWMTRHSLRTLVKKGHPPALKLLGFHPHPKIQVGALRIAPKTVRPGEAIEFSVDVTAERAEALIVDYVIEFVKANGSTAPKVFKAKHLQLNKGETVTLEKRHPLRANATTFTLYPGTHRLTIQINGTLYSSSEFKLTR